MTAKARGRIRLTETFPASAERVFDAWLSPEKVARWFLADAEEQVARVEIDARAGGVIRFVACRAGRSVEYIGKYLEIQRPRRLRFTIHTSASGNTVLVTILIEPRRAGCSLTLISERVSADDARLIEPAPLHAVTPVTALRTYRAEEARRIRWPTRLECKAGLSLGLHLAMLPLLPIVLREPELPPAVGPAPALGMVAVDLGAAQVKSTQSSYAPTVVAPGPPSAPVLPAPATPQVSPAARPSAQVIGRSTLRAPPSRPKRQPNRSAVANHDSPGPQTASAPEGVPDPTNGPNAAPSTGGAVGEDREWARRQARRDNNEAMCSGFAQNAQETLARVNVFGESFHGGQKIPVRAHFYRDRNGSPWVQFYFYARGPANLPVTMNGDAMTWTGVLGTVYTVRPSGNGHLSGLARVLSDRDGTIDLTCEGSDALPA